MRQFATGTRRWIAGLSAAAVLLGIAIQGAIASPSAERIERFRVDEPVRLMVQLHGAPLAEQPGADQLARLELEHQAFRDRLRSSGIPHRILSSHRTLFNGVTVRVDPADAGRITGLRGVSGVFLSRRTQAPVPQLFSSVRMIGSPRAWAGDPANAIPGVDGTGITVAIIDTGIDYTHPDLGGCFGEGCRVIAGYDLVGDEFDGASEPAPDDDPMDQNGHGTHVAGIVGAKAASAEGVTGVAPGVRFVALKVFGEGGSTWDDIILKALEMAYDMKVDVVNMSIGAAFQWPQYPTAMAVQRLADKGIVIATSAGNSGGAGEFATGAPAVGNGTMAVASFENDHVRRPAFLDHEGKPMGYDVLVHSPNPPAAGASAELAFAGLGAADSDFLNPDGSSKVRGKVALIERGAVPFRDKTLRAQKHGAVQVIIYNNQPGMFRGTLQSAGAYVPTLAVTKDDGLRLREAAEKGPVQLTWTDKQHLFRSNSAGTISEFSSWGPAPDLAVKPDLTAPGGSIYSTFPVEQGSYATLSGTSMSAPHVAGAAALILQARREMHDKGAALVKSTAVRTLLMNTSVPRTDGPDGEELYPVHRQGAGHIDVWRAITATQRVRPEKVALGVTSHGARHEETIVIENIGTEEETYTVAALGGAGLAPVEVKAEPAGIRVPAGRTVRVKLSLTVPASLPNQSLFSGWITVNNQKGEPVAHLPYLGFIGDYQKEGALDPMPYGFPWLARLDGMWLRKSAEVEIHPACECDAAYAWIIFSLGRQAQELRLEIWDPKTGRKYGNAFLARHTGRSAGSFEIFVWDGKNDKGRPVPAGTYVLRLMALRPLGDPHNPAHWDQWTSGRVKVVWD